MNLPQILVLDDDQDLLDMVCIMLEQSLMQPVCINDDKLLYSSIAEKRPDLILMDIYLGAADGRKICVGLKKNEDFRGIPVILYSAGYITIASIHECMADAFIVKPFDMRSLVKKINDCLHNKDFDKIVSD